MDSPRRIIGVFLVDFVIGISLILMACLVGGAAHHHFTPDIGFLYLPWFCIALVPFLLYLNWRDRMGLDWWDFLVYGSMLTLAGYIFDTLPALPLGLDTILEAFLLGLIFAFVMHNWESFRSTRLPRANQKEEVKS